MSRTRHSGPQTVGVRSRPRIVAPAPYEVSPDVTVALTGVSATGAVGSVGYINDTPVYEVPGFGTQRNRPGSGPYSLGKYFIPERPAYTPSPDVSVGLSGVYATGAVGSLGTSVSVALTGVEATGAVGTLVGSVESPDVTVALTGVSAIGYVGTLSVLGATPDGTSGGWDIAGIKRKRKAQIAEELAAEQAQAQIAEALVRIDERRNKRRSEQEDRRVIEEIRQLLDAQDQESAELSAQVQKLSAEYKSQQELIRQENEVLELILALAS